MDKSFYFHDVLQTQNLSSIQKKELENNDYFELFKTVMKPFEGIRGTRVVLLIVAEGINEYPDVVEYIKQHPEWEIGCHGLHHEDYSKKSKSDVHDELASAKNEIINAIQRPVFIFVPPWKKYNKETEEVCEELGMKIDLDSFFSIKHLDIKKIDEYERFDVHYWWKTDRKKLRKLNFPNFIRRKETPEFWDKIWKRNYKSGIRKHIEIYKELKKYLNGKILDLACGVTNLYDDKPYDVTGVDLSPLAMKMMKERCPTGTFIAKSILNVDFPAETFDTIILSSIIEHFRSFDQILINAKRFLKKNGTIIIVVPLEHHFRTHVHCKWDENKIEKEIGGILGKVNYYQISSRHGIEWFIIYKKGKNL